VRERLTVWDWSTQERAERLPALTNIEDQRPLRGDCLLHLPVVFRIDGKAMRPVGELAVKGVVADDLAR
jgi:hypothetical protein